MLEDGGGATVVVGQDGERMDRDCNGARGIYLQQVCRVRADLRALAVESKYPVPSVWRTSFYRPEVEGVLLSTVGMADISFEEDPTRRSGISSTSVHGSHCRAAVVRPEFIASTAPARQTARGAFHFQLAFRKCRQEMSYPRYRPLPNVPPATGHHLTEAERNRSRSYREATPDYGNRRGHPQLSQKLQRGRYNLFLHQCNMDRNSPRHQAYACYLCPAKMHRILPPKPLSLPGIVPAGGPLKAEPSLFPHCPPQDRVWGTSPEPRPMRRWRAHDLP